MVLEVLFVLQEAGHNRLLNFGLPLKFVGDIHTMDGVADSPKNIAIRKPYSIVT
jgi:hypothetical protein